MTTAKDEDSTPRDTNPIVASMARIASKHDAYVLAAISAAGYLMTRCYYKGIAANLGLPFDPSIDTGAYASFFMTLVIFGAASAIGLTLGAKTVEHSEDKPIRSWVIAAIVIIGVAITLWLSLSAWRWLIKYVSLVLPAVIIGVLIWGGSLAVINHRFSIATRAIAAGITLALLCSLMFWVGVYTDTHRSSWRLATINNQHYVVVGHTSDWLIVAPLVSTSPPTYIKRFQYLKQGDPELRLQNATLQRMKRHSPRPIQIPTASPTDNTQP